MKMATSANTKPYGTYPISVSSPPRQHTLTSAKNHSTTWVQMKMSLGLTLFVVSGACQPLLMTRVKKAGLGDATCQLYMFFYYLGPALVSIHLFFFSFLSSKSSFSSFSSNTFKKDKERNENGGEDEMRGTSTLSNLTTPIVESDKQVHSPSHHRHHHHYPFQKSTLVYAAMFIATIDILAQAMNYTGSAMAGPTVFAILYSSVGIWTALYSRILFQRKLNVGQWMGVFMVFLGLTLVVVLSPKNLHRGTIHTHSTSDTMPRKENDPTNRTNDNLGIERMLSVSSTSHHNTSHHSTSERTSTSSSPSISHSSSVRSFSQPTVQQQQQQQENEITIGTLLIFFGSMIHALTYVLSEAIMNVGSKQETKTISHDNHDSEEEEEDEDTMQTPLMNNKFSQKMHKENNNIQTHLRTSARTEIIPSTSSVLILAAQSSSISTSTVSPPPPSSSIHETTCLHPSFPTPANITIPTINGNNSSVIHSSNYDTFQNPNANNPMHTIESQSHPKFAHVASITVLENSFIQASVALLLNLLWQICYTLPHFYNRIYIPMQEANTTWHEALLILFTLSILNALHTLTFYYTLKHFNATTAAVMKGLQAILVFVLSWLLLKCTTSSSSGMKNRNDNENAIFFSWEKILSLLIVVSGVVLYGYSSSLPNVSKNTRKHQKNKKQSIQV